MYSWNIYYEEINCKKVGFKTSRFEPHFAPFGFKKVRFYAKISRRRVLKSPVNIRKMRKSEDD